MGNKVLNVGEKQASASTAINTASAGEVWRAKLSSIWRQRGSLAGKKMLASPVGNTASTGKSREKYVLVLPT